MLSADSDVFFFATMSAAQLAAIQPEFDRGVQSAGLP